MQSKEELSPTRIPVKTTRYVTVKLFDEGNLIPPGVTNVWISLGTTENGIPPNAAIIMLELKHPFCQISLQSNSGYYKAEIK